MKKLAILFSILALTPMAFGQYYVNALNAGSGIYLQVRDGSILSGTPIRVGSPANAAGFIGAGPGQVIVEFFAAPTGTPLAELESGIPIFITTNSPNPSVPPIQGTLLGGLPLAVPYSGGTLEFIAYASSAGGTYTGWSAEATGIVPSNGVSPTPVIFGTAPGLINSFIIGVPEPTTVALGIAGAAGLFFFRRKK